LATPLVPIEQLLVIAAKSVRPIDLKQRIADDCEPRSWNDMAGCGLAVATLKVRLPTGRCRRRPDSDLTEMAPSL
jgi:hypothetical protein